MSLNNSNLPRAARQEKSSSPPTHSARDSSNAEVSNSLPLPLPAREAKTSKIDCIDTKGSLQLARKYDQKAMQVDGNPNVYRSNVCVICDRFIIGCEAVHKITKEALLSQSSRISVESYEAYHQVKLKRELISQYEIEGLEGLLLSPRAKKSQAANKSIVFDTCSQCFASWSSKPKCPDTPPRHAISNGFAIGHIPENNHLYIYFK